MKILGRTQFGNPILRKKAKKVSLKMLKTASFKMLVKRMIYTMRRVNGVGLAAPQIGKSMQLVVIETRPTPTRPTLKHRGPIVVINPRILRRSKTTKTDWEGCLSFDGIRGRVPRATSVIVEYYSEQGERVREEAKGLWAAIFQHEIDHLNGITYVDRMKDHRSLVTLKEFKKKVLRKAK